MTIKKTAATEWLGKIRGHIGEARSRFAKDKAEREAAGKLPKPLNIILTEREVRGDWDASRVLMTTLGGKPRPLTSDDLAVFRQNMRTAQRRFKGTGGITPRQVIDLASSTPLHYVDPTSRYKSDIEKARREITQAVLLSAHGDVLRFRTNAGPDSKDTHHNVVVQMKAFHEAAAKMAATDLKDSKAKARSVANWLRKQKIAFDCDCARHRYFFRYVATIGGFAAGRQETGYPKIRNPKLHGVACKHVLRVMAELESSGLVLGLLTRHLENVAEYKSRTTITQKEAEAELKKKKTATKIKTSEMRKAEAEARRAARAFAKSKSAPGIEPPKPKPAPSSRKKTERAANALAEKFGMTPEEVMAILAAAAAKKGT